MVMISPPKGDSGVDGRSRAGAILQTGPRRPPARLPAPRPASREDHRSGILLFLVMLALMCLTIVGTVLHTDGSKPLQRLFAKAMDGIAALWPSPSPPPAAQPPPLRGRRIAPASVLLPQRFFHAPRLLDLHALVRPMPFSGTGLCRDMAAAGLETTDWQKNLFDASQFQCMSEKTLAPLTPEADPPSFFMIVKGDGRDRVVQIRLKIVEATASPEIRERYETALDLILARSRWADFAADFARLKALQPGTVNHFGIQVKMTKEFTGPNRYNISITAEDDGELERRSRASLHADHRFATAILPGRPWPPQRLPRLP